MIDNSIYRFIVQKINGDEINLSTYKNKVLLIVNTASECGFAPQLKEMVALKNEFAGTGIGLAMCRKIVQNHNGEINAEGSNEKGAVFNVYLPMEK